MKEESKLTVKQAEPDDINDLILINRVSFANYMNTKMGRMYSGVLFGWFVDPKQNADGISFVICSGAKIAGFVVGARIGYQKYLNKHLLLPAALGFMARPYLLLQKRFLRTSFQKLKNLFGIKPAVSSQPVLEGEGISLVGIAVHPDFRGQKAGSSLMKAFEEEAGRKKYDYMRLTVLEENKTAIKMYSDNGWKLLEVNQGTCSYYKYLSR